MPEHVKTPLLALYENKIKNLRNAGQTLNGFKSIISFQHGRKLCMNDPRDSFNASTNTLSTLSNLRR